MDSKPVQLVPVVGGVIGGLFGGGAATADAGGASNQVEAHVKIKSRPFRGSHQMGIVVGPAPNPAQTGGSTGSELPFHSEHRLYCATSFHGYRHHRGGGELNDKQFIQPSPGRWPDRVFNLDQLEKLSSGAKQEIEDGVTKRVTQSAHGLPVLLQTALARAKEALGRGLKTSEYRALLDPNILDAVHAVTGAKASQIPQGQGVTVNNAQPYPVYGWLEAKWLPVA